MNKALFLFADYYDATTASRRVLSSTKDLFDEIEFMYWARTGKERISNDIIFDNIKLQAFTKTAQPRSIGVLFLSLKFQFWIFKNLFIRKPKFVVAFTFFTIFPALLYKYLFCWKCKVIYDPRDYIAVSFRINKFVVFLLNLADNVVIKLSNFIIFPDNQYFSHYGKFKLDKNKYLIIPNSSEDLFAKTLNINIYDKYKLPKEKKIIPFIGYFSENRGSELIFNLIKEKHPELHFVFAGDIRSQEYLDFFDAHKENTTFIGRIPYIDALTLMKESLLSIQLSNPLIINDSYALFTKFYDCLMVGTPIIVSSGQINQARIIKKNNFGWVIQYDDLNILRETIFDYIKKPHSIQKEKLRAYFLKNYDYTLYKIQLKAVYSNFLSS